MADLRKRVALYTHDGMSPEEIAAVTGIAIEKLRAVFARELEFGSAITRAARLDQLVASGDGGSVAANARILDRAITEKAPTSPGYVGKKVTAKAAAAAAVAAGGRFVPRAAPIGKKELAAIKADDAEQGTAWQDLVPENGKPN